jgi:sodium transport system permease protein
MKAAWTVFCKELLDAFRDRRMLLVAFVIMPLAVPLILAGLTSLGARRQAEQLYGQLVLPIAGAAHAPNLIAWLATHDVVAGESPADAEAAIRAEQLDVVLHIDGNYATDWRAGRPARVELLYDGSRPLQNGATIARVRALLQGYSAEVGTLRLVARGIHPSVANPLQVGNRDLATSASRFDFAQQLLPYLLMLLSFVGGMQLAIDATAGERERQSLEPLLATPASREAVITGKVLATAAFTLISLTITLLAFRIVLGLLSDERLELAMDLPPAALLRLFVVILPVALLGATVLTALAAFARSHREAQSYLQLLIFVPMLPTLFLMVAPVTTRAWMLAVPFLGQNQLILRILRGETIAAREWAICVGASLALVALVWALAARLYHREQLAASS